MSMQGEPDSKTIDAWLAGKLSDEEVKEIERWFDENPEHAIPDEEAGLGDLSGEEAIFEEIVRTGAAPEDVPAIEDLIHCITRSPDAPSMPPPAPDAWREVVCDPNEEQRERGLLGTLGSYEVIEVIATGGMGIVFRGYDPELKRVAALKVLAPDLAANATARERFLREARSAAALEHENILPIYGVVDDGIPWFAMRYAAGGTLQDRLDRGEDLDAEKLKSITRQVASALEAAHSCGIIHRDIKPANLLFDEDGEHIWVCDFGIARSTEDPGLTYPGTIAGTPKFMSPEQAAGRDLDGRSDLFSLGAVLYRCAAGEHVFTGTTTAAVLHELDRHDSLQIQIQRERMPMWFQHLLSSLLAKDPADRPGNALALVRAVGEQHFPRPKRRRRASDPWVHAGLVALALSLIVAGALQIQAVEKGVNSLLALRLEQAFFISGKTGAYSSLRDAISSARDGDTIRLPGGVPITVDNLLIHEGKSLTLVAADPEQRPTLTTEIAGSPGLVARSPIRLKGIDFLLNAKRDSDGIFIIDNCPANLVDCQFVARRDVLNPYEDIKSRAVELRGKASLAMESCDFDLHDTNAITVLGEAGDIRVSDTSIAAFSGIDILGTDALIERVSVQVDDVKFSGQRFLRVEARYPTPDLEIEANRCKFICERPAVWFRNNNIPLIRSRTRWKGHDNHFRLGNGLVQMGENPTVHSAVDVKPVTWLEPADPVDEPPEIEIQGTGEVFEDLAEAVSSAPNGATLLLSGRIEIKRARVITPVGKRLHFCRHPEAVSRPSIVAESSSAPALVVREAATFSGIRFVRYDYANYMVPILDISAGPNAEVLIEDCDFEALPSLRVKGKDATGVVISDTGNTTIRRCLFRCRKGIAGATAKNSVGISQIKIEESVFTGLAPLNLHAQSPEAKVQWSVSRSVFHCRYLFTLPLSSEPIRCHLSVEDSLLDIIDALIFLPDRGIDAASGRVTWEGNNNDYGGSFNTFRNSRTQIRSNPAVPSYQFLKLTNFDELAEKLPGSKETGSSRQSVFDREQLHPPILPDSLRSALSPGIESSAVETLQNFTE